MIRTSTHNQRCIACQRPHGLTLCPDCLKRINLHLRDVGLGQTRAFPFCDLVKVPSRSEAAK